MSEIATALAPPVPPEQWDGFQRYHPVDAPGYVRWACLYPERRMDEVTYSWACHRCFIVLEANALADPTRVTSTHNADHSYLRGGTLGEDYLAARGVASPQQVGHDL